MKLIVKMAAAIALVCFAGAAQAATVSWDGTDYDIVEQETIYLDGAEYEITTFYATAQDIEGLLKSQVWWGDSDRAAMFSSASASAITGRQPFFAYEKYYGREMLAYDGQEILAKTFIYGYGHDLSWGAISLFAIATPVETTAAVPLPASAFLLLSGIAGLGALRARKA